MSLVGHATRTLRVRQVGGARQAQNLVDVLGAGLGAQPRHDRRNARFDVRYRRLILRGEQSAQPDWTRQPPEALNAVAAVYHRGGLPVQLPTKFEVVVNPKTAKALGWRCRSSVRARADEVIE
jgi:hypothetical protein